MHLLPEGSVSDYVIRPQFRKVRCWFSNDIKVLFAYFNGISSVLFLANFIFIIHTSVLLYKAGVAFTCCRTRKSLIQENSNIRGNERLLLNMFWHRFCLFALMAINWSTEVLSLIPPIEMWVLTDILNTLQGLFVFILFIRSTNKRIMLVEAWKKVLMTARRKMEKKRSKQEEVNVQFLKDSETEHVTLAFSDAPK
ncbi:putative G-protein coupled receptor Mth-like 1 [Armadillidium vulgare]|nr:putative G-protein coupled receptor Mth-like 1 [Armadillidium vulgare]